MTPSPGIPTSVTDERLDELIESHLDRTTTVRRCEHYFGQGHDLPRFELVIKIYEIKNRLEEFDKVSDINSEKIRERIVSIMRNKEHDNGFMRETRSGPLEADPNTGDHMKVCVLFYMGYHYFFKISEDEYRKNNVS